MATKEEFENLDEYQVFEYINNQLWELEKQCREIESKFNKFKKQFDEQNELELLAIEECCLEIIDEIRERYAHRIKERVYPRNFTSRTITEDVRKSYEHKKW